MQYRIDPANRDEERHTYDSAYAVEAKLLAFERDADATATASHPSRDAARIRQLLDTAAPSERAPVTTHPERAEPDPTAAAPALGAHEPYPGAGHELG